MESIEKQRKIKPATCDSTTHLRPYETETVREKSKSPNNIRLVLNPSNDYSESNLSFTFTENKAVRRNGIFFKSSFGFFDFFIVFYSGKPLQYPDCALKQELCYEFIQSNNFRFKT
jgi:hypothetical protein